MDLENLVSKMMTMTVLGRLWHWTTETAQHHVVYEQFLTQNETLTDSIVESSLGNDLKINFFSNVGVKEGLIAGYSIDDVRSKISGYREEVISFKEKLEKSEQKASAELATILDDVVENCSKTLYLLRLK